MIDYKFTLHGKGELPPLNALLNHLVPTIWLQHQLPHGAQTDHPQQTYGRICADKRHRCTVTLREGEDEHDQGFLLRSRSQAGASARKVLRSEAPGVVRTQ